MKSSKCVSFFLVLFQLLVVHIVYANEEYPVGITPDLPYIMVNHQGEEVKLHRIQDTSHTLPPDLTRTSRPCPPFCISPLYLAPDIKPVGEIEVVDFLQHQVKSGKGFLVDARLPNFYKAETIPGAINIPWVLFKNKKKREAVFTLLGATKTEDNHFDFTNVMKLYLFCSGPACGQSPRAIRALYKAGYPASKLKYYRGGLQLWKLFGFITIVSKENIVGEEAQK